MADLRPLAVDVPELLLPAPGTDLGRWAVVACDQYTSQRDYWERVAAHVGDAPSTLHLVLPEAYLGDGDEARRVAAIHARMRAYLESGVLAPSRRAALLVDRETPHVPSRRGLMLALDLEHYDYHQGARTLARATEATFEERLPARVRVRDGAPLELPHVMVLIDDPEQTVIEPLAACLSDTPPLYDAQLWPDAGRVRGWAVDDAAALEGLGDALAALARLETFQSRYGVTSDDVLLYAVGDGNHSLAAARLLWERARSDLGPAARETHPARFALIELVNVHDPGMVFEPIHRVVFDIDPGGLLDALPGWFAEQGARCRIEPAEGDATLLERMRAAGDRSAQVIGFTHTGAAGTISIEGARTHLPVASLQAFLDVQVAKHPDASIDYIHGDDVVRSLASGPSRIGFYLPVMPKHELFRTVVVDGALPAKTFSMGEAEEKRFYLEARRILP